MATLKCVRCGSCTNPAICNAYSFGVLRRALDMLRAQEVSK